MKSPVVIFSCVSLLLFSSCDNSVSSGGVVQLTQNKNFILGQLCPDLDSTQFVEIFVGSISPNGTSPIEPPIGSNKELNRQIFGYRNRYRADISGREDAQVRIIKDNGESVELRHVGRGFYRDVNRQLALEHEKVYSLQVRLSGKLYTAATRIPSRFGITNIREGELIRAMRGTSGTFRGIYMVPEIWSSSSGSVFHRAMGRDSNSDADSRGYTMQSQIISTNAVFFSASFSQPAVDTVFSSIRVIALDTNFARGYEIGGDTPNQRFLYTYEDTERPSWIEYYRTQSDKTPIRNRSNIIGSDDVVGTFGSYAEGRVNYRVVRGEP